MHGAKLISSIISTRTSGQGNERLKLVNMIKNTSTVFNVVLSVIKVNKLYCVCNQGFLFEHADG